MMIRKPKPYYYISAQLDLSSVLPQTPDTEFEELLYLSKNNNLDYLADPENYSGYHIVPQRASITDVVVSSNPPLNQSDSSENVEFEKIQVLLTETPSTTVGDLTPDTLILPGQVNVISCSIIDPGYRYAYFGTDSSPARILKVDLNTFEPVSGLTLSSAVNLRCAVVDPQGQFAYFGAADFSSSQIVKINLTTFTEQSLLSFSSSFSTISRAAVIDPNGQFMYVGTYPVFSPGSAKVIRIDLVTFTFKDSITLNVNEQFIGSAVIDGTGQYAYFGSGPSPLSPPFSPGQVVQIDLSTFTRVGAIALNPGEDRLTSAVIDPSGQYAYFGTLGNVVVKVNLGLFTRTGAISLSAGETNLGSAVIDQFGQYAYFGTNTSPGNVVKIDLNTFTRDSSIVLGTNIYTGVYSPISNEAYFGEFVFKARVFRVDLSSFLETGNLTFLGVSDVTCAVVDNAGQFAYFAGLQDSTIAQVNLNTFVTSNVLALSNTSTLIRCAVVDPTLSFAYFAGSQIYKIDLVNFSEVATLPLPNVATCGVVEPTGKHAYFALVTFPGLVKKVDLDVFSVVDSLTFNSGDSAPTCAVIDPSGQYAYFGTNTAPGRVVRVDLETFTLDGTIICDANEDSLVSAVVDPNGRYAYFGTGTDPGKVVKIDLKNFIRVGAITFQPGEANLSAAAMEPSGQYMYFGTRDSFVKKIFKIATNTFTQESVTTLTGDNKNFSCAFAHPFLPEVYFGTETNPGRVVRLSTIDNILISGPSQPGFVPENLENTTTVVDIDNKAQQLKQTQNNRVRGDYYLALYVKGRTGALVSNSPHTIQTQIKVYTGS